MEGGIVGAAAAGAGALIWLWTCENWPAMVQSTVVSGKTSILGGTVEDEDEMSTRGAVDGVRILAQ